MPAGADRIFIDTNVLLYWMDSSQGRKYVAAREWIAAVWESRKGAISWQVLNEFYTNATAKLKMPAAGVRALIRQYDAWGPITQSLPLMERAWQWSDRAGVPYWDALILAAAEVAGAEYLLSEDFQTGRRYGSITIIDPFRTPPAAVLARTK